MAQIPRQFLRPGGLPSVGRTRPTAPQTQPGSDDRLTATALAESRNLDLTPIGDALYKAGGAFVEMEKERRANELAINKMKQQSAARGIIVEATQKANDLHNQILAERISDPVEARNRFYTGMNEIMAEYDEPLKNIGEFATEPFSKQMSQLMVSFGPSVSKQAIALSREQLVDDLNEQKRMALTGLEDVQDDEVAEAKVQVALDGILDSAGGVLSDYEVEAFSKKFITDALSARFRGKFRANPAEAMKWLGMQHELDPQARDAIVGAAYNEGRMINAMEAAEQRAQEKALQQERDARFKDSHAQAIAADADGNLLALRSQLQDVLANRHAYDEDDFVSLTTFLRKSMDPNNRPNFTSVQSRALFEMANDPTVPVHVVKRAIAQNAEFLSTDEWKEVNEEMYSREGRQGEAINQVKTSIRRELQGILGPMALLPSTDAERKMQMMNPQAFKDEARARQEQLFAEMDRYLRGLMNMALDTGGAPRNNYQALVENRDRIIDQTRKAFAPSFQDPSVKPPPPGGNIKNMITLYATPNVAGQPVISSATVQNELDHYIKQQEALNENYDPNKDANVLALREASERYRKARRGVFGPFQQQAPAPQQPQAATSPGQPPAQTLEPIPGGPVDQLGQAGGAPSVPQPAAPASATVEPEQATQENEEAAVPKGALTREGLDHLSQWEGRRNEMYDDATGQPIGSVEEAQGFPTIGIGHLITAEEQESGTINIGGEEVDFTKGLTDEQIDQLAQQDAEEAAAAVDRYVKVDLTPHQRDALISFAFNIGGRAFGNSGAIKALNAGNIDEFLRRHAMWNKSRGQVMEGLKNRRAAEAALFQREQGK